MIDIVVVVVMNDVVIVMIGHNTPLLPCCQKLESINQAKDGEVPN
jgi:hypothetical protein